jgi:subtilisin-like proprotein convertase family protein
MKHTVYICLASLLVSTLVTRADVSTFTVQAGIGIPDGGLAGVASQANVSGIGNGIGDLLLTLDISGTYNGDLYAYLSHNGNSVVLLNRVGNSPTDSLGYDDHGIRVTFQDGAPNIHNYRDTLGNPAGTLAPLTGTWGPDGRRLSPFNVNGTETPTTALSSFLGSDLNGDWTLFVADVDGGDLNTLNSWSLEFVAVPESQWWGAAGLLPLAIGAKRTLSLRRGARRNPSR